MREILLSSDRSLNKLMISRLEIQQLLDPYDGSQTECDGMTQICYTVLVKQGIESQPMAGSLRKQDRAIEPHFWIDLPNGDAPGQGCRQRIDYRASMWLGSEGIPHGVFNPQDFPDVIYEGDKIELKPLPDVVFQILTWQIDHEKLRLNLK
jgi:hypothetical protein